MPTLKTDSYITEAECLSSAIEVYMTISTTTGIALTGSAIAAVTITDEYEP
jgi:hypothetical protein